ncbi:hypothetical protein B296_00052075 [Ensete ventricosum]|uniref:Uncharacterized protein n=1 Tax=Ensete ventricosum TaxID=4639 RepID=A0A426X7U3_ENSVE|nr:hypothetical protein B296_00052075 [Ensete ventricosum]
MAAAAARCAMPAQTMEAILTAAIAAAAVAGAFSRQPQRRRASATSTAPREATARSIAPDTRVARLKLLTPNRAMAVAAAEGRSYQRFWASAEWKRNCR